MAQKKIKLTQLDQTVQDAISAGGGGSGNGFVAQTGAPADTEVLWVDTDDTTTVSGDIAADTHAATSKATPVDADELPLVDSAASNALKKLTWANLKATAKTYFDTLYTTTAAVGTLITAERATAATLTNKTIAGGSNTISGIAQSSVTSLTTDLAAKAPTATPTFTGRTTTDSQVRGSDFELTNVNGSYAINAYYSSGWKYIGAGKAFLIAADDTSGGARFYTAPTGATNGTISWTERQYIGLTGVELAALKITGGTPGLNKVLTSDASGNATWQTASGGGSVLPFTLDTVNNRAGLNKTVPTETLDVVGNFQVGDAATRTKGYRFRTSGSNLDVDFAGGDAFISVFANADYTGGQYNKIRLENGGNTAKLIGTWNVTDGPFGGTKILLDGTNGDVTLNNQAGTGTRMLTTSATGVIGNAAIPSSGETIVGKLFEFAPTSISTYTASNNGSGTLNSGRNASVRSGTTSGSWGSVSNDTPAEPAGFLNFPLWAVNWRATAALTIDYSATPTAGTYVWGVGGGSMANTGFSAFRFTGFQLDITSSTRTWTAITGNGTSTTTTTLTNPTGSFVNQLYLAVKYTPTSVAYYMNGTLVATHTTNIPATSSNNQMSPMYAAAGNKTTTTNIILWVLAHSINITT